MSLIHSDLPEVTTTPVTVTASAPAAADSSASSTTEPSGLRAAHRDRAIDLIRFGCLVIVVVLHSMLSSAVLDAHGEVVPTVALSTTTGFTIASWFFQIMPLFFFIGGYAALNGWRRTQADGGTWADYLRARLRRLIGPVVVLIGIAAAGLSVASGVGVPADLLAEASTRIGQPLWFLAVYVGLTSLVPLAVHVHERAPRLTMAALAGAVVAVDGVAALTGVTSLGYLNFLFVWPLVQQCGFFYADAIDRPVRVRAAWTTMVIALVVLGGLVGFGVYSPNMLVNLNPPTGALVLLGVAQMSLLRLSHARLNEVVSGGTWERVITWGNTYGIQVYLWHMSIVITLIGLLGYGANLVGGVTLGDGGSAAGFLLPEVESTWWWLTRLPWLITVMGLAALAAMTVSIIPLPSEERLARASRHLPRVRRPSGFRDGQPRVFRVSRRLWEPVPRAVIAVVLAVSGISIALLIGIAPLIWTLLSLAMLLASLVLAATLKSQTSEQTALSLTRRPVGDRSKSQGPASNASPETSLDPLPHQRGSQTSVTKSDAVRLAHDGR
ncbi:MAG: acyltransferase [Brevibacterium sp.]|nr:acyltransferase [Brevibacterium sp.]MDN6666893.1 acyltransferase [Brevibacterium sp.]